MKTVTVEEFKAGFLQIIPGLKPGEQIAVTPGNENEIIGYFMPKPTIKPTKRKSGILEGKVKVVFKDDFKMTEEELCRL